jgi:hypothetical protein
VEDIRTSVTPVDRKESVKQKPSEEAGFDEPYRQNLFKKELGPVAFQLK